MSSPSKAELRRAAETLREHGHESTAGLLSEIASGQWTLVSETAPPGIRRVSPSDLMLTADVRRLCGGIERWTLIRWRQNRGFPEPIRSIKVGRGKNSQTVDIYDRRDVRAWLKANPPLTREIRPGDE